MSTAPRTYDTTIGKKLVMALSGLGLLGFVVAHMLGNLQVFVGRSALNDYASLLHERPALLWAARIVLVVLALAHVLSAYLLWRRNRAARPIGYKRKKSVATTYAARTMVWTGPIVLLYLGAHLAHLTFGVTDGLGYSHQPADVYANVVASFRLLPVALVYVAANLALGVHLYHGAWSLLQTLGIAHRRYDELLRSVAVAVSLVIVVGFIAVPVGVLVDHYGLAPLLP